MTITLHKGDITQVHCDAIVNPANSLGYMGGGVAGALKRAGGIVIEQEARKQAPIPLGTAIVTQAGSLPCTFVIHAPTMEQPAMRIGIQNILKATKAALKQAEKLRITRVALPGMGTGVGGVTSEQAAQVMSPILLEFSFKIDDIIICDRKEDLLQAFRNFLSADSKKKY